MEQFAAPGTVAPPRLRRKVVLVAAGMAMFMAAVEATIVATAMPTIVAELGGFQFFSWVFGAYLLTQAVSTPIYGKLADLYGRKRVFFCGAALFLLGSALCGFAWGMLPLIAFRALQGLGAGAIRPIATTIIGDLYAGPERGRIQGFLSGVWGISAIVGPLLGAFLVLHVGWPVVFWLNLPVGVLTMTLLGIFLHEVPHRREHRIDYLGSALLMFGVGSLMLAAIQANSLSGGVIAVLAGVGLVGIAALVRHVGRAPEPIFPLRLWSHRLILLCNLGSFCIAAILMGMTVFLPPYIQGVMGLGVGSSGLGLAAMSVTWVLGSIGAGHMIHRSARRAALIGALCLLAGNAVLVGLDPHHGLVWIAFGTGLSGFGMGFCNTTFLVSVQGSVEQHERGTATSANIFMWMVGQSLGTALFGAVLNLGVFRAVPDAGDALNRLMEPALRATIDTPELARLTAAFAASLQSVYAIAWGLAAVTLALAWQLPRRRSETVAAAR